MWHGYIDRGKFFSFGGNIDSDVCKMKITFQPDFIYLSSKYSATLIFKNCDKNCSFCPAGKLFNFQDYATLNQIFDFTCRDLTIYGCVNCSYIESFIIKLKKESPNVTIKVIGCDCRFSQKIEGIKYHQIIYPDLSNLFVIVPEERIIPATGDPLSLKIFALREKKIFPNIPLRMSILDSSNVNADFWSENQIEDFQKQIDTEEFKSL